MKSGTVPEDVCTFITCIGQNTREYPNIFCSIAPPPENRSVYEIMWKNMAEPDRQATDTHS